MTWDNSLFDEAFDQAGIRDEVTLITGEAPYPTFMAKFDMPQQVVLDGEVHTTDYVIEFTSADVDGLEYHSLVMINNVRYRVRDEPMIVGDGHWTRTALEKWV